MLFRSGASTCGTEVVFRIGVLRTTVQVRELDPATNSYVERLVFNSSEDAVPEDYTDVKAQEDVRFRIALAEGATSWQIIESLKQIDILEGDPGEVPAEGMLAPDSYEVTRGVQRADLVAQMMSAQEQILADAWATRDASVPLESPEEAVILASIVEKETSVPAERRQVASVFVNRLNQGMRLQTDPTVIYGITRGQGALGRGLRRSELQRETPWNTYVIDGLPPTPIANPGRAALLAAGQPADPDFTFLVADGTGGHAFAETLGEHNRNVARWRDIAATRSELAPGSRNLLTR